MLGLPLEQLHKWKGAWGDLAIDGTFTHNPSVRWKLQPETGLYHLFWDRKSKACWALTNHQNPTRPRIDPDWRPIDEYHALFSQTKTMLDPEMELDEIEKAQEIYSKLEGR